jgi:hypothetical protein
MNSNLEENWDANCEVYQTSNKGTVLEPKSLRIEKQPIGHRVSSIRVGARREVWTWGS